MSGGDGAGNEGRFLFVNRFDEREEFHGRCLQLVERVFQSEEEQELKSFQFCLDWTGDVSNERDHRSLLITTD